MNHRGRFITVEGIEGVGKSTTLVFIEAHLRAHGVTPVVTREPGGTALAERIRSLVLDHGDEPLPELAELLLIFAARSTHLANLIRPQLAAGNWVVCDRFSDATFAYQGGGRGLDLDIIEALASYLHGDLWPDLTLLLDCPVEVGRARRSMRGPADRIEAEQGPFFERVRRSYLERQAAAPKRIKLVNAAGSIAEVHDGIQTHLEELLSNSPTP